MTEIESNVESFHVSQNSSFGTVENDDLTVTSNPDGDISLTVNCGVEIQEDSTTSEGVPALNGINGDGMEEEPAVNGIHGDSEEHDMKLKIESPRPYLQKLSDSDRPKSPLVEGRVRKSSMERLLEESLNTAETADTDVYIERKNSHSSEASSTDGENNTGPRRKSSIYEQKNIEPPSITKGNIISSRTQNLFHQYKRDISYHEARPMININEEYNVKSTSNEENVNKTKTDIVRDEKEQELREIKKQYQQRLIDEEREKAEERARRREVQLNTIDLSEEDADVFLDQHGSSSARTSTSSNASLDTSEDGSGKRRTSIYNQKQIDAPCPTRGNIIAARTEHLFKQYSKDMTSHVAKPVDITEGTENVQQTNEDLEEKTKIELAREQTKRELQEVKLQFHQRLVQEEKEKAEERAKRDAASGTKSRTPLGSHMNRYVAVTQGEISEKHNNEGDDDVDGYINLDKQGVVIEKSGGKVEIVKSSDSISDIKSKFGGTSQWKKAETETPLEEVDKMKVNSARSVFKEKETTKNEHNALFNRPCSKKVHDPKQLMEIRKKVTYGEEGELPQDGIVQKSVQIETEELDPSCRKNALNMYKNLEKKEENRGPLQKPKTRLLTDMEVQASMEGIRSISSSASEASDVNETANDLTVDTVSGYGSAAPCSPSSTFSEDYLSDTKDNSMRDKVDELKEGSQIILSTDDEPILTIEAKIEANGIDDSSFIVNGHVDVPPSDDMEEVPVNSQFV